MEAIGVPLIDPNQGVAGLRERIYAGKTLIRIKIARTEATALLITWT